MHARACLCASRLQVRLAIVDSLEVLTVNFAIIARDTQRCALLAILLSSSPGTDRHN